MAHGDREAFFDSRKIHAPWCLLRRFRTGMIRVEKLCHYSGHSGSRRSAPRARFDSIAECSVTGQLEVGSLNVTFERISGVAFGRLRLPRLTLHQVCPYY